MEEQYPHWSHTASLIIPLIILSIPAAIIWMYYKESASTHDKKYSTFWPRFWAQWVDSFFIVPPIYFILHIVRFELLTTSIALFLWFIAGIGPYCYSVIMHGKYGQTVGKMVCKVKVLNFNKEENINYKTALLRDSIPISVFVLNLIEQIYFIAVGKFNIAELLNPTFEPGHLNYYLGNLMIYWWGVECLTMLTNKKRRAIHDFIAGTVVVRTNIIIRTKISRNAPCPCGSGKKSKNCCNR